ncbi:MAG: bifunctional DNA primase/polymerase [Streptosporangiaceae bacterium]|nr:bifunctional DNA primase/polymerase [Streptosporangiaceae bacterium]
MIARSEHDNPRLAAARRHAQAGWPVFPCKPGEKVPATRHGFRDAATDPDRITWWWTRHSERNVAIVTGCPGPDVLDVDVRPGGNGFAAFGRLRREGLLDGASTYVRTPSGGLHAYFTGSGQGNGRLPAHHLDFRSRGGYILAPPSRVAGRPYTLLGHRDGTAGLGWAAVTRLLDPQPQHRPGRAAGCPADTSRLAGWVARLSEGNRNDGLFWAANRALDAGHTDLSQLADAARKTGLDEREITRTLASARRHADRPLGADLPGRATPEPASQHREAEPS